MPGTAREEAVDSTGCVMSILRDWVPKRIRKSQLKRSSINPDATSEFHFGTTALWPVAAVVAASLIWLWLRLTCYAIQLFPGDDPLDQAAKLGDTFNVVNSLFSAMAFGGIIWTILLQRQELRLQREELEATREELRKSAEAQEKSQAALSEQVQWMSLTPYLTAVMARRHADSDAIRQRDDLLDELISLIEPEVAAMARRKAQDKNRAAIREYREMLIHAVRHWVGFLQGFPESVADNPAGGEVARKALRDAFQSIGERIAGARQIPGGYDAVDGKQLDEALVKLTELDASPLNSEPERFWYRYDACVQRLGNWVWQQTF